MGVFSYVRSQLDRRQMNREFKESFGKLKEGYEALDKNQLKAALRDMYEDVREPLLALSEVRRAELEKQQKIRENKINQALFLLSLMGAFSAVVDSSQIIENFFSEFWSSAVVEAVQKGCAAVILLVLIYVAVVLFRSRKK